MHAPVRPANSAAVDRDRRLLRDVLLALALKVALLGLLWRLFFSGPQTMSNEAGVATQLELPPAQTGVAQP